MLSVAQCSFFSVLKPFGVVPDLILGFVVALSLISTLEESAVVALAAGFTVEALGAPTLSFSALFYLTVAVVIGIAAKKMIPGILSYVALLIPAEVLGAIYTTIMLTMTYGGIPPAAELFGILVPEMIVGAVFSLPIYFIVKLCSIPIETRGRFTFR